MSPPGVPAGARPVGTLRSASLRFPRLKESSCPSLTRYFRLLFFYVPVKRSCGAPSTPQMHHHPPAALGDPPPRPQVGVPSPRCHRGSARPGGAVGGGAGCGDPRGDPSVPFQDPSVTGMEGSTNDISHYIGLLDPWYERNVLGLMKLPMDVLCQVCAGCPVPNEVGWQLWLEVPPSHFLSHFALPVCQARG